VIGVLARPEQRASVEEFFELFKTPWEHYRPGKSYDVVIVTADTVPETDARLIVILGSSPKQTERDLGVVAGSKRRDAVLAGGPDPLPIYGGLQTFRTSEEQRALLSVGDEVAAFQVGEPGHRTVRAGYDLFDEVSILLAAGQPVDFAPYCTLELHIEYLRKWMLGAGVSFFEIRAVPAGYDFIACLTHDIDFVGIRPHFVDHSMLGFVYRGTVGALRRFVRGRMSAARLLRCWSAVLSLPFVYAGWTKDFWEPFDWYLEAEKDLPTTYFLIPFKGVAGERVPGSQASRRASAYGVSDIQQSVQKLRGAGCEVGVHGLDSWHSVEKGCAELKAITDASGAASVGVRIHWLLQDENTPAVLEQAGYSYDSTCGFNECPGYRAGTTQVFRPPAAKKLLELPMHIQDGALFYPKRSNLSEAEAFERCETMFANAERFGGVVTLLWHDRSHGAERFWGDFYKELIGSLRARNVWFGSGAQVVEWFRSRREIRFEEETTASGSREIGVSYRGPKPLHQFLVRVNLPHKDFATVPTEGAISEDIHWNGESGIVPNLRKLLEDANTSAIHPLT